uniref:Zinc finger CCCH domain-containing protein 14 n=1 Tax=Heterorhabditis bacteriophora TaxID=37862 RepID=A0A1I7XHI4_HETBA
MAAIKAKLEELGVYVDDELPEYIMVMIANKKEKNQMKDDLNLFLGKSTTKFVDWLFDLFDRLQNASSKADSPSEDKKIEKSAIKEKDTKDKDRRKELENYTHSHLSSYRKEEKKVDTRSHHTIKEKNHTDSERDKEREKTRIAERSKEKEEKLKDREERRKEKDLVKKLDERNQWKSISTNMRFRGDDDRREQEHIRARDVRQRDRRSRSRTWSDDEFEREIDERNKKVASSVVAQRPLAASPEPVKVSSQVIVKRKLQPVSDEKTLKARKAMFLKAMNEASVSAGYGAPPNPMKPKVPTPKSSPMKVAVRSALRNRITIPQDRDIIMENRSENDYDSDTVVCGSTEKEKTGGPKIVVTLKGAKDHIRSYLQSDRIGKPGIKRKSEPSENMKSDSVEDKRARVEKDEGSSRGSSALEVSPPPPVSIDRASPVVRKWDGQIQLDDDSSDDDEAEIDAVLADARNFSSTSVSIDDEALPPTHQLSRGKNYIGYSPTPLQNPSAVLPMQYIPTPLSREEVSNKIAERCRFWPACRQGDSCTYIHPNKQCINFPNCTFGARCLYIHPPCRFDRNCTNPTCAFTHGMKAVAAPVAVNTHFSSNTLKQSPTLAEPGKPDSQHIPSTVSEVPSLSSLTPCRFGAGCKNPTCSFKHPKACHYGSACLNPHCYFYHPPQTNSTAFTTGGPAKYKWKATTPSTA